MKAARAIREPQNAGQPPRAGHDGRAGLAAAAAVALAGLALLLAGCGGGSPAAGVAKLGTSKSSSTPTTAPGTGSGDAQPGSQAVAYSACMREHGVPSFPDPKVTTNGNEVKVAVRVTPGITGNPHFNAAQNACKALLPEGGGGGPAAPISPKEQSEYLKAAACIRSHGIPDFPDPTFSGGGVHLPKTAGVELRSAKTRAAEEACQSLIPGGLHGNH